jgi:hypothetical protein
MFAAGIETRWNKVLYCKNISNINSALVGMSLYLNNRRINSVTSFAKE